MQKVYVRYLNGVEETYDVSKFYSYDGNVKLVVKNNKTIIIPFSSIMKIEIEESKT